MFCDVPEETKRNGLTRLRLVRGRFFSFLFFRAYYSTVTDKSEASCWLGQATASKRVSVNVRLRVRLLEKYYFARKWYSTNQKA